MIYRKSAAPEPLELGLTPDQRFELAKLRHETLRVALCAAAAVLVMFGMVGGAVYVDTHRACTEEKR